MFKIDFKNFKKVASDKNMTTLQHPAGHTIKIAHRSIHPKVKAEMDKLPLHAADAKAPAKPKKSEPMMANGGDVEKEPHFADGADPIPNSQSAQDSPEQIVQDASQAPPKSEPIPPAPPQVDPDLERKRQIYNQDISSKLGSADINNPFNMAKGDGLPDDSAIASATFGANGESPKNFDAATWNQEVVPQFKVEKAQQNVDSTAMAQKQAQDMQAKQDAGIQEVSPVATKQPDISPPQAMDQPPKPEPGDNELAQINANPAKGASQPPEQQGRGIANQQEDPQQTYQNAKQLGLQTMTNERQAFQHDIENQHISPQTLSSLFGAKDTVGKMGTLAGLFLGGIGSGVLHQENPVIQAMQSQIDNDLKAQQLNLGKSETLLSNNLQMFGNLPDALKFSKINMMDAQLHQLAKLASKYPGNQKVQQQLAMARMAGAQSTSNLMDNIATNQAYMHMMGTNPEGAAQAAAMSGDPKMAGLIANRLASSGGVGANMLPYLDNEARQATVQGPDGKYHNTGSAANAKEYNEQTTSFKPIMADLNELSQLNNEGVRLSPDKRARAESLKGTLTTELNDLAKSHRISESDIGFEKGRFSDPTAFGTLLSGNAATNQLKASLARKMGAITAQYIPGYKPVAFTPKK